MAVNVERVTPLLQVYDLPNSIAFYRDVLGFEMIGGDDSGWAMLKLGGAILMLNTAYEDNNERPAAPDPARVTAHADAALFFWSPDPDGVYSHLRERQWPVKEPFMTSYGMRQVYTNDPDGFELCFQCATEAA
jgi:glyoxylase I family protein